MKHYDVIVVGGGTAGALAGIAAARQGAKTLVVERFGHLGGTAVYGIPFLGLLSGNGEAVFNGMVSELLERLQTSGFAYGIADGAHWRTPEKPDSYGFNLFPFDPEGLKYVLQEMLLEAGGEMLLHTTLSDVVMDGDTVRSIRVCSYTGSQELSADLFLDCTGDANLTALAGGQFQPKGHTQNSSILFHLGGIDLDAFRQAMVDGDRIKGRDTWHTRVIYKEKSPGAKATFVHMAGHLRPFEDERTVTFTAVSYRDGEIHLNATRIPGLDPTDPWEITRGEIEERRHVMELVAAMRKTVPGCENAILLNTAPLGIRESRNILGLYTITRQDVLAGRTHFDGVARGSYPIDIHDPKGGKTQFQFIEGGRGYEVPFRAMIPAGLGNMIVAGRCISADQNAIGSVRIMGCCLHQGVAAGTAAALCVKEKVSPALLDGAKLKQLLL